MLVDDQKALINMWHDLEKARQLVEGVKTYSAFHKPMQDEILGVTLAISGLRNKVFEQMGGNK